ncbi:MAG: efflux RND transporter periplasmic adaptor subunit [Magnetospirillum sp.]|nr:efflux RND transporter periplasmic adaptor subunit [Magnetospirillum sp.]
MADQKSIFPVLRDYGASPWRKRLLLLGALASLPALGFFIVTGLFRHPAPTAEASVVPTRPGVFQATEAQWEGLGIAPVRTLPFQSEDETDGKIANDDDVTTPVFSPFSGRVTKVFAKAGDRVEARAPLLAVEATEIIQAQNDLVSAAAAAATARAQFELAKTAEKRQHELYLAKGGALKDWQQAQVDLANAQGTQRTAEIALATVRNRLRILGKTDKEIEAIETAPETAPMTPEAVLSAPIGGTVIQRQVGVGQYINSAANGGGAVFAIGDQSKVWLVANVRETDAPAMRVGEPVEVTVLAFPGRVFKARLTYVAPALDPATRRLPVRAEVENPDGALKPEMFASFRIITGEANQSPSVPEDAVIYEGDTARVWVAHDDRSLTLRSIRTGRSSGGMVEVLSGLEAGEKVVTSGALFIDRAAKAD